MAPSPTSAAVSVGYTSSSCAGDVAPDDEQRVDHEVDRPAAAG